MLKKFKKLFEKFFLLNDTPHKIAGGAALGIFLGAFPGVGVLATLVFATILRLNKLSAIAGVLAVNVWLTLLLLPPSVAVGSFLFRRDYFDLMNQFSKFNQMDTIKESLIFGLHIFSKSAIPVLVGFFIVAGSVSIGFYFLLLHILKKRHIEHLKDSIHIRKEINKS